MRDDIVLWDGPNGTPLWNKAREHGYPEVPVWIYSMEHPEIVEEMDREYVAAGAQIVLANTFAANPPAVRHASSYDPRDVIRTSVNITKKALEGTDVRLGLAVGPLSAILEPYGDMTEQECCGHFEEMIGEGVDAGAQLFYIQTFLDINMMKIATEVASQYHLPMFCSMALQSTGHTIMGASIDDIIRTFEPMGVEAVGFNCTLGPDAVYDLAREFASKTDLPIVLKPNAGLPQYGGSGVGSDPESFARTLAPVLDYVKYIGGCCGCDPSYTAALRRLIDTGSI